MALEPDLAATLLLFTKQVGGSGLHVSAGAPVMARVHDEMRRQEVVDRAPLPRAEMPLLRRV